ncbi:hypothetical protein [Amycolatopsis sp. PS_44_ISF1]|uniref:hypothetical protein n=1 Tax=Amycolatopsis sp. PS_44_ISF1 TaxID=2974917 RepID=UPI0028DEBC48|nr:hypothetical protein [Amycolatopsis sp. PS_44_ISF1]MDT8911594.1 hypothetical protein [Amycolatopsis sp. PS_44_ISF1]
MIFGIWPGVVQGDLVDLTPMECHPEDPRRMEDALRTLQGDAESFYLRCYRHFGPGVTPHPGARRTPADPGRYAGPGRLIDLVACYQSAVPDPAGFAGFVRRSVRDVAAWGGGKVQVGEEPNAPAPQDGGSPGCLEALAAGVAAALDERTRHGAQVHVGVNAAGPADPGFWAQLLTAIGPDNAGRLDYLGLDLFPDVFHPIPEDRLGAGARFLVDRLRSVTAELGVPEKTPIHVTETGWPTGEDRDEDKQARVLSTVARAILDTGEVSVYEFFGLRDGRTDGNWRTGFGLLREDYTPKPAYAEIRRLIAQQARHDKAFTPGS